MAPLDRRSPWRRLLALLLVFVLAAAACGGDDDEGGTATTDGDGTSTTEVEPVRGGTLVYAVEADTALPWDPTQMICAAACHSTVGRTVFEPLAVINEAGEAEPYLLESITGNADSTEFVLKLREGIKFHDGTALDADAVKINMDRTRASILLGPALKLVSNVASDGQFTVTVTLSDSWTAFPLYLNSQFGYMGSPTWEAAADADPNQKTKPVGTGPFKFKSYESGENGRFQATRFAGYWRGDGPDSLTDEGLPYLDAIDVRFIPSSEARTNALLAGDIDLLQTDEALEIQELQGNDDVVMDMLDNPALIETAYLLINHLPTVGDKPNPMADLNVRKAVAFATDYETLTRLRAPLFPIANGPFPPETVGHLEDTGFPTFDLDEAKRLVSAYEAENGQLTIAYKTTTDPANLDTAEVLKQMWEAAGMTITIDQIAQGEFIGKALAGDFQVFGWRNHSGADPDQQYVWWTSENTLPPLALNFGRIKDPKIDELMTTIRTSTDETVRKESAEEVNTLFAENIYNIWTNWVTWALVHSPNVHGAVGHSVPDGDDAINLGANLAGIIMPVSMFKTTG